MRLTLDEREDETISPLRILPLNESLLKLDAGHILKQWVMTCPYHSGLRLFSGCIASLRRYIIALIYHGNYAIH